MFPGSRIPVMSRATAGLLAMDDSMLSPSVFCKPS